MKQPIIGFHLDNEHHWVAQLARLRMNGLSIAENISLPCR